MKYPRLLLFTFVFIIFSSPFVAALTTKPLSLKQLVYLSTVVRATLIEKVFEDDVESGHLVAYYTFKIKKILKPGEITFNREAGETFTIKQLAQLGEAGWDVSSKGLGPAEYEEGKTYLLFLSDESPKTGLTAPVGLSQGRFLLKKRGGKWVAPGLKHRKTLFRNLEKQVSIKTLNKSEKNLGSGLTDDYDSFESLIQKIAEEE